MAGNSPTRPPVTGRGAPTRSTLPVVAPDRNVAPMEPPKPRSEAFVPNRAPARGHRVRNKAKNSTRRSRREAGGRLEAPGGGIGRESPEVPPDRDVAATEPPKPRSATSERAARGHTGTPARGRRCEGPKVRPRPCSARHRHAAKTEALGGGAQIFCARIGHGHLSLLMILSATDKPLKVKMPRNIKSPLAVLAVVSRLYTRSELDLTHARPYPTFP